MAKKVAKKAAKKTSGAPKSSGINFEAMISEAPINIMLADRDLNITYLNPSSVETLKTVEQYLPCTVDEIVGSNVDIFHKDPTYQRNILSSASNLPQQAIIDVGPEKLDLLVSAVLDDKGNWQSTMVTWSVVTQKLKSEAETARLSSMVENAPINIMLADRDLNIVYVNPASVETLKPLEQYLPVPIDQVVGSNIDIFHKDPAYQRNILGNINNLPKHAIIDVGPEKLDLLVSPIKDTEGNWSGTMVSWSVVTQKLKADEETARPSAMIENAPINIMLADRDLNITYVNPASVKTLKPLEQYLPVPISQVVGSNIDIFHKDPSYQRGILGNINNLPRQAIIDLGPEKLDLLVSPIKDRDGNWSGTMVCWSVITQKLKADTEAQRLSAMVENAPINIMYADVDLNLVYLNPASKNTLRTVEQYLPAPVDQLVGQSIDIFHKNPAYQRQILGDAGNLPRNAKIKVGPETLDLEVSAVLNTQGERVGTMVAWSVITDRLKLAEEVLGVVENLGGSVTSVQESASSMASGAQETASQAQTVAAASEEATTNVNTVAAAAEEMSASIKEISNQVQNASSMAASASNDAERASGTMSKLNDSSQEIGQVIKVITSIAQQTNLLALNATIEAARAGEAGKGFAVVANEVKELARQTAQATEEISQKIAGVQSDTDLAVKAIEEITAAIGKINEVAGSIASAVEQQNASTQEIARNVGEASKGTAEVTQNITSVSKVAGDSEQLASSIQMDIQKLNDEAVRLKSVIASFANGE